MQTVGGEAAGGRPICPALAPPLVSSGLAICKLLHIFVSFPSASKTFLF
jgi:hypothetical protein